MLKEVECDHVIEYEEAPGARFPVIDPYDGCLFRCPYCFQWEESGWNDDIIVKSNIADLIPKQLDKWDKSEPVYVGSRCDPYMLIEKEYGLTRRVLEELAKLDLECFVTTKSGSHVVLRDIDIFKQYGAKLTLCPGLSNILELQRTPDQSQLPGIWHANRLFENGVNVRAFITPVLPGITDVEVMMATLAPEIPVSLDRLRIVAGTALASRFTEFIRTCYPRLERQYKSIIAEGRDTYFDELKQRYASDVRVSLAFPDA